MHIGVEFGDKVPIEEFIEVGEPVVGHRKPEPGKIEFGTEFGDDLPDGGCPG